MSCGRSPRQPASNAELNAIKAIAEESKVDTLPKPNKEDFIDVQWFEYTVDKDGKEVIDTVTEHIHKELIDIFKLYVTLNSFIDGVEVNKGVGSYEFGKTKVVGARGKRETVSYRRMPKREAIRKYGKKNRIHPRQVKNILLSHDILVKSGHTKIVNNIYALFHSPDYLLVAAYESTVQFLKDADLYEVLNDDTMQSIDNNLKELEKYDSFKTIHWHKLRELPKGTRVNMPVYAIGEGSMEMLKTKNYAVQTVFTFKKIDDERCLINDKEYLYTELRIVNKKDEKNYRKKLR
jgi:tRNA A37 threonylcarbamoyladenosine biosynthesis protein TsaE